MWRLGLMMTMAVCCSLAVCSELAAQTVSGEPVVVTPATPTLAPPLPAQVAAEAAKASATERAVMANEDGELPNADGKRRLTRKERQDLGLTWLNVHQKAKELYQAGEISSDMSRAEIAALIFGRIALDHPTAFADPTVDWDAILAFIEAILPLILQIIGLFSYLPHAAGVMVALAPIAIPIGRRWRQTMNTEA